MCANKYEVKIKYKPISNKIKKQLKVCNVKYDAKVSNTSSEI